MAVSTMYGNDSYGELIITNNATATTINTASVVHLVRGYSEGQNKGLTVTSSATGSITAFADAGGGNVTVTSAGHGLSDGQYVSITGTTNYNGLFKVQNATTNTFEITDTWVSDDGTGTFDRGSALTVHKTAAYQVDNHMSLSPAGANKDYEMHLIKNGVAIGNTQLQFTPSNANDNIAVSVGVIEELEAGDVIQMGLQNATDTTDITVVSGALCISEV